MKRTLIAALASLMLAGAISAVNGATTTTTTGTVIILGDGSAPIPPTASPKNYVSDGTSLGK